MVVRGGNDHKGKLHATAVSFADQSRARVRREQLFFLVRCDLATIPHFRHRLPRNFSQHPIDSLRQIRAETHRRLCVVSHRIDRRDKNGKLEEPSEFERNHICKDRAKLKMIRSRLSDISWWMRLLSQNIAQRANKEDLEVGKFWQARYRAIRLLDETAILARAQSA